MSITKEPDDASSRARDVVLCRHLRTKRFYYGSAGEVQEVAELSTTAQFWCLRTLRVVGPDGDAVSGGACRAGRSCCETAAE